MKLGSRPKFLLKFAVSLGLVTYLATIISWRQVWESILQSRIDWLALGYIQMLGMFYLQALRWKILLQVPNLPVFKYLHFIFVGLFYRIILPGSLSADMLKVVLFGKKYNKPLHESGLVFFSQFLGMSFQWIVGAIGLFYFGTPLLKAMEKAELSWRKLALMGVVALALLIAVPFIPAVRAFAGRMFQSMRTTVRTPGVLVRVIWVTLGIQILTIGASYCIFWGMGVHIPLLFLCFQMALAISFAALPISINGIGVVDYLNLFLLQNTLGTPAPKIIAVSVASYSLLVLNALIGGAWMLFRNVAASREDEAQAQA